MQGRLLIRSIAWGLALTACLSPATQPAVGVSEVPAASPALNPKHAGAPPGNRPQPAVESPLTAPPSLVELPVSGFPPAVASFPTSASWPQPVLVATHGAGGSGRWHCEHWRRLLGQRGVILCPNGKPLGGGQGHYYPNHFELERVVLGAIESLEAQFPEHVDSTSMVFAGYSQGATMGALMAVKHAKRFPRLVLVEGGFKQWNVGIGIKYRRSGGDRTLFACGTAGCEKHARQNVEWLTQAKLGARTVHASGTGHTYGGNVAVRVREALPGILRGDPRWQLQPGSAP